MSDIRARIAEVLREHDNYFLNEDQTATECVCGWQGSTSFDPWTAHVADVLAEQLGLTQEWGITYKDGSGGVHKRQRDDLEQSLRDNPNFHAVSRSVTPWVRADDETGGAR